MKTFTQDEIDYIYGCWNEVDEVVVDIRKGVPQTRYVIEVQDVEVWCHVKEDFIDMPKGLVGLWIQEFDTDNLQIDCCERLGTNDPHNYQCSWVRAEEVVTKTYKEKE